ncbi:hypothetical protein Bhyg_16354 [Pseudolycoriella hygida]|uniref:CHK kinase-like domain-containing protein n=1 Tax=Pseudolycoriella hygida TaxID=35572 RepID=A0A9Q0MJU9_9DIPT|nr:hypothetical protein Bhyg_16354 [Pseudolycoriella hygida]
MLPEGDIPKFVLIQLKEIAEKLNYINCSIERLCARDGYVSSLSRFKILGQLKDTQLPVSITLICKTLPTSDSRIKMLNSVESFEREVYFYTKVLPILEQFQRERLANAEDGFVAYPKCFVAKRVDNQIIIILEDLRVSGYEVWNRDNQVTFETASIVMRQLGKFHAVSFALRDQCPEIMEEFSNEMTDMLVFLYKNCYGKITREAFNKAVDHVDDPVALSVLTKLKEKFLPVLEEICRKNAAGVCGVIGHGDFYENNILFRYDEKAVTSVAFLDFQFVRVGSPAFDICYYLLTSTNPKVRQNYDKLLHTYHESLQTLVRKLGSDANKLFSYNDLVNQMTKFGKYGVIFMPFLLQITLAKPNECVNLDDIENDEQALHLFRFSDETKGKFKNALEWGINDAVKFGWIKPDEI